MRFSDNHKVITSLLFTLIFQVNAAWGLTSDTDPTQIKKPQSTPPVELTAETGSLVAPRQLAATIPAAPPSESRLSPQALDIAKQLSINALIEKLEQGKLPQPDNQLNEVERLKVNLHLNRCVIIAGLQVRDVTARIERELAIINRLRGNLEDRRDRAIKLNSIENIGASGAMSEIANGSTFMGNQVPANVVNLVAGAATIGLGSWALRQQSGAKERITVKPNMLAKIFDHPVDKSSDYPPVVWTYLNSTPVGAKQSRLETLKEHWKRYNVIPRNLVGPAAKRRIAILTNSGPVTTATIDTFNDQADMLFDLRTEVYQLDSDLLDLMQCLEPIATQ